MLDKTRLGTRYTCFECGTKFYDLNRPEPTCPECSANQKDAPQQDIKSLLSTGRKPKRQKPDPDDEPSPNLDDDVEDGDDDDGDLGLGLGNDDDDDDDDDDDGDLG